jgi:hypothetical protein
MPLKWISDTVSKRSLKILQIEKLARVASLSGWP